MPGEKKDSLAIYEAARGREERLWLTNVPKRPFLNAFCLARLSSKVCLFITMKYVIDVLTESSPVL